MKSSLMYDASPNDTNPNFTMYVMTGTPSPVPSDTGPRLQHHDSGWTVPLLVTAFLLVLVLWVKSKKR